jgi:hypothetical protein
MIAGSYPIWIVMLLIMRHLCAVCDADAAAANVQTGGWGQSFSVGMVLPCRNRRKMGKKRELLPKCGKNGKKSGKRAKIQVKYRKMLLKLCVFAILR